MKLPRVLVLNDNDVRDFEVRIFYPTFFLCFTGEGNAEYVEHRPEQLAWILQNHLCDVDEHGRPMEEGTGDWSDVEGFDA